MGRGNVCVFGKYEGLYFVNKDYIDVYTKNEMDENGEYTEKLLGDMVPSDFDTYNHDIDKSEWNYEDFVGCFTGSMKRRFSSLEDTGAEHGIILKNSLFVIAIEDNEWSYAIELLQYSVGGNFEGLQKRHYKKYLEGIKSALFEQFEELGTYTGPWTSGRIRKEKVA